MALMAQKPTTVSFELFPLSPQQKHVLAMIENHLRGLDHPNYVEDPKKVALAVWRLTRIEIRPFTPSVHPPAA